MAEQGSDIRKQAEAGPPDICHANHAQPVGSRPNPESIAQGSNLGASTLLCLHSHPLVHVSIAPGLRKHLLKQNNSQSPGSTDPDHLRLVGPQGDHSAHPARSKGSIISLLKPHRERAAPGWVQMSNCTRTFQAESNFLLLTQGPGEQQLPQTAPKMHINRGIIPY